MTAIERIQGFSCEVDQEKWEELVRVADGVGGAVNRLDKPDGLRNGRYNLCGVFPDGEHITVLTKKYDDVTIIPYPDFLSKLKGEEKWEPKAGEMVEVWVMIDRYEVREYAGFRHGTHLVWAKEEDGFVGSVLIEHMRPIRPTITRQEAESLLNKRIID